MRLNRSKDNYRAISDINITPFVDVMLVLLIIFMVTAPIILTGVKINLPTGSNSNIENEVKPLSVTIDKKGLIYLNNREISLRGLDEKLKQIQNKERYIYILADVNINYGYVIEVINTLKSNDLNKITFVTEES